MDAGPSDFPGGAPQAPEVTNSSSLQKAFEFQAGPRTLLTSQTSAMTISLVVIATVCTAAAAIAAKAVLVPTLLAALLALALTPVTNVLERCRIPSGIAAAITVLTASAAIAAISLKTLPKFVALAEQVPTLIKALNRKILPFQASFRDVGDATEAIGALVGARSDAVGVQTVQIAGDSAVTLLLGLVPGVFAQFFYVVFLSIFILSEKKKYRQKLITANKSLKMRLRFARMIRDIGKRVSGYFFVLTILNIFDGVATAAAFYFLGLPDPILWGVAFGVANFVPVIGATSVIVASALIGIAVQDNLIMALAGPVAIIAINTAEGNIIQPLLLSRRMVVNPVALLLSFAFFTWMWGAAATVLSVPMVVCFSVIAKHTPGLQPLAVLLTNEKPVRGSLATFLSAEKKQRTYGTIDRSARLSR